MDILYSLIFFQATKLRSLFPYYYLDIVFILNTFYMLKVNTRLFYQIQIYLISPFYLQ